MVVLRLAASLLGQRLVRRLAGRLANERSEKDQSVRSWILPEAQRAKRLVSSQREADAKAWEQPPHELTVPLRACDEQDHALYTAVPLLEVDLALLSLEVAWPSLSLNSDPHRPTEEEVPRSQVANDRHWGLTDWIPYPGHLPHEAIEERDLCGVAYWQSDREELHRKACAQHGSHFGSMDKTDVADVSPFQPPVRSRRDTQLTRDR